jgi:hypothetical protein
VLVSREQDAGAGEGAGRGDALVEHTQELSPLFTSEVDVVALEHGLPFLRAAQYTPARPIQQIPRGPGLAVINGRRALDQGNPVVDPSPALQKATGVVIAGESTSGMESRPPLLPSAGQ